MKTLITNWVVSYAKKNYAGIIEKFLASDSAATYLAKALQWLLDKAIANKNYATVRKVAEQVQEQASLILSVTEDGVISSDEGKQILDNASKLLGEWYKRSDSSVTDTLRNAIAEGVSRAEASASK